jgi:hypothetical protein
MTPQADPAQSRPQQRTLRFETIDDALAEAERLVGGEREGRLAQAGTWPLGQTLGHLATWAGFAFDGYPASVQPPWLVRTIGRMLRNRILTKGMMPGMKVGRVPGGTLGLEPMSVEDGLARYREAMQRLRTTAPTIPNPVFGPLTHEQWIQLNLRHAELHFSFLHPH